MTAKAAGFDYDSGEFLRRWEKARMSAFDTLDRDDGRGSAIADDSPAADEAARLERFFARQPGATADPEAQAERKDALLRGVFGNSRRLALSFSRHHGISFEIQDFQSLLQASGIPCFQGDWIAHGQARSLNRAGCGACEGAGHHACEYWREALEGLVAGLGESERIARHACARRGDAACIDVLFTDTAARRDPSLAWGPLPGHMALELLEAAEYARLRTGTGIELKGVNEGVLGFEVRSATDGRCGDGKAAIARFAERVRERFPGLALKDVTPLAVMGGEAGTP